MEMNLYKSHFLDGCPIVSVTKQNRTSPYPGLRYTLPVPTVKWVHFMYLKPLVCILNSTGAIGCQY